MFTRPTTSELMSSWAAFVYRPWRLLLTSLSSALLTYYSKGLFGDRGFSSRETDEQNICTLYSGGDTLRALLFQS